MSFRHEKIISGIKYFVKNTNNVGRTKLFKLLFFWDFIHFKKYGKTITGYDYYTYPFGPVPKELFEQIVKNELPQCIEKNLIIEEVEKDEDNNDKYKKFLIKLKSNQIDLMSLTPSELSVLKDVAFIFKDATATQMTEITHLHNTPWTKTKNEKGMDAVIGYELALDDESPLTEEEAMERLNLQRELIADGRI